MRISFIMSLFLLCLGAWAQEAAESEVKIPAVSFGQKTFKLPEKLVLPPELRLERNREFRGLSEIGMEHASGSDIIGNGTGVAEQNIQYMLRKLDRHLANCLNDRSCLESSEDKTVLKAILKLAMSKRSAQNAVVYLDEAGFDKVFGGFGDLDQRVAKTGFDPEFPVFINVTEIYENGLESDLSFILGLLVHELGHQLGIASHTYLDKISAAARASFDKLSKIYSFEDQGLSVELIHFTSQDTVGFDYGVLRVNDSQNFFSVEISERICPAGARLTGLGWSNLHFDRPSRHIGNVDLKIKAWGNAFCEETNTYAPFVRPVNLAFDFEFVKDENGKLQLKDFESFITE